MQVTTGYAGLVPSRAHMDWTANAERDLVARAKKHDQIAFAQLYDHYVNKIYRYIYFKVGRQAEAEDLTAQVFLKAWEAVSEYIWTDRPFAAWLYRIAHNLVVDHFRALHAPFPLDDYHHLEEPGAGPHEIAEQHISSEALQHMLRALTPDQHQVLLLRFVEGYNTAETARIMGKTEGAVRTLQHRACAACSRFLAREHAVLESIRA